MDTDGIRRAGQDPQRALGDLATQLSPFLDSVLRDFGKRGSDAVRERAFTVRLSGTGRGVPDTGLRRALAASVGTQYQHERVTIVLAGARMPAGKQFMPAVSVMRSWRHPVFGNRNVWVTQSADAGWFAKTVIREALRDIPQEIVTGVGRLAA